MFTLEDSLDESCKEELNTNILLDNMSKGRILAMVVILIECILFSIGIASLFTSPDNRFYYYSYIAMYSLLILLNIIYLIYTNGFLSLTGKTPKQLKHLDRFIIVYITVMMCWGAVVTLMDQKLYGQLMAYMINMIACSSIYALNTKRILIPYVFSLTLLAVGLPFFQTSSDLLVGHYVNLFVFALICWFISRLHYSYYCKSHSGKFLLQRSNQLLESQIEQNIIVNKKLSEANLQLKKLSLVDELTCIPNRRSFRSDIEKVLEQENNDEMLFSAVMIDIDFFKQYNDNYGHTEGDAILVQVANQITSCLKHSYDYTVRWGGEEFVYAAFFTNEREITAIAERMREKILSLNIPHERSSVCACLSASFGTCTRLIRTMKDVENCIECADRALYLAKASGRNRVRQYKA